MAPLMCMVAFLMLASVVAQSAVSELPGVPKTLGEQKTRQLGQQFVMQNPDAMLTELKEMVSSGETPSFDMISAIKSIIQDDIMPDLQTTRDAAEQETTDYLAAIQKCNNESKARAADIEGSTQVTVNNERSLHATCRDAQKTMHYHNLTHADSYCVKLGQFLDGVRPLRIPDGSIRHLSVQYVKQASNSDMCGGSDVTELADKCTGQEAELNDKKEECSVRQRAFQGAFCIWKSELEMNCKELDSCYSTALTAYEKHVTRMETLVKKWNVESAALQKILCYCNVWLSAKDEGDNRSRHNATQFDVCRAETHTPVPVNYSTPAAKVACPLTSVAIFPGSAAFIAQEYGSFSNFTDSVIPCAESCFSNGTRVQIKKGSRYAFESCDCATLENTFCDGGEHISLLFDDGDRHGAYEYRDLEICTLASAYTAVNSSGSCSPITSISECANAGCKLRLLDPPDADAASDDEQNGQNHDPPYCYFEGGSLKFNVGGTNTGPCSSSDKCVCKAR